VARRLSLDQAAAEGPAVRRGGDADVGAQVGAERSGGPHPRALGDLVDPEVGRLEQVLGVPHALLDQPRAG
jgi:hypothetical protein